MADRLANAAAAAVLFFALRPSPTPTDPVAPPVAGTADGVSLVSAPPNAPPSASDAGATAEPIPASALRPALRPIPEVPDEPESTEIRTAAWITAMSATAMLSAGGVLLYQGLDADTEADTEADGELDRSLGYGLLGSGLALAGLATWLFLRDDDEEDDETTLMIGPGGATWQVRW